MPPKKSNLNNASTREARRKHVKRAHQLPEQVDTRNAAHSNATEKNLTSTTQAPERHDANVKRAHQLPEQVDTRNTAHAAMEGEQEEYIGHDGRVWNTDFLTKLATILAKGNTLLTHRTSTLCKRMRRAAKEVAEFMGPPLLSPPQVYRSVVSRFNEIYEAKHAEQLALELPLDRAPEWMRLVEPYMRPATAPEPATVRAEAVLRALTERARALRTTAPGAVCRALPAAPHARPDHLARVWARMKAGACAKLDALISGGDSEAGLQVEARLSRAEWRLVDVLLLHDTAGTLQVVREEHVRQAEPLRALVAVFHLVQLYRLEEGAGDSRGGWRAAAAAYRRRGRLVSAVLLQKRWHDLKLQTRTRLVRLARAGAGATPPAALHVAIARRFPQVVVAPLPPWQELVNARAIVEDCDLTETAGPRVAEEDRLEEGASPEAGEGGSPKEGALAEEWVGQETPPARNSDDEDDLIIVEREVETVDLLEIDDDDLDEQVARSERAAAGVVVKREFDDTDQREELRARRRRMARALERELDRQLRDLDAAPARCSPYPPSPPPARAPRTPPSPLVIDDSESDSLVLLTDDSGGEGKDEGGEVKDEGDEVKNEGGEVKDEEAEVEVEDKVGEGEDEKSEGSLKEEDEEPSIDPKLLMTACVPLMRVDAACWRDLRPPPRAPPALPEHAVARHLVDELLKCTEGKIRIVSIKSEDSKGGEEEGGRRGRIRLPDIAEVRRINSGMKTAQVAPLTPKPDAPANPPSRRSSGEGELCIDEGEASSEAGGTLTGAELRRVLRECTARAGSKQPGVVARRWRDLYCCAARHHRALNDARRRCAARGGRPPPPDVNVHASRCVPYAQDEESGAGEARAAAGADGACSCCCRHLLDVAGAARALAAERARLLADVQDILAGTYRADQDPDHTEDKEEPAEGPPPAKKAKKKRDRPPRHAPPSAEPAADPLQEWIRQKNLTSRFFDLNLKKPPKPPEPPVPPLTPATARQRPSPLLTIANGTIVGRGQAIDQVKVTVNSDYRAVPPTEGAAADSFPVERAPIAEFLSQQAAKRARKSESDGLPPNAIPITMLQTTGGVRLVPLNSSASCAVTFPSVVAAPPAVATPPDDVIDLCDDDSSPSPSPPASPSPSPPASPTLSPPASPSPPPTAPPSPPPTAPPSPPPAALPYPPPAAASSQALLRLPPGISVKWKAATLPPADARAEKILSNLPPGIQVKRRGALEKPAPRSVVLNECMTSMTQNEAPSKKNSNIKVFKISEDGLLTPSSGSSKPPSDPADAPAVPPSNPPAPAKRTKLVLISRKALSASPVGSAPRLINSLLAEHAPTPPGTSASPATRNTKLKISEIRTADGKRLLVMRPPKGKQTNIPHTPDAKTAPIIMSVPPVAVGPPMYPGATLTPLTMPPLVKVSGGTAKAPIPKAPTPKVAIPRLPVPEAPYRRPPFRKPAVSKLPPIKATSFPAQQDITCKYELVPDVGSAVVTLVGGSDAPPDVSENVGGVVKTLDGGATVRPAAPKSDLTDMTITLEEWRARGGAPVQVMERGVQHYRAGAYYVRTNRPLPFTRAAVWTTGPESTCARILLTQTPQTQRAPQTPQTQRAPRGYSLLLGGVYARAEWVCRSPAEVAAEVRGGARLRVVHAVSGITQPLTCARPPRPNYLALRCAFLTAQERITRDVNTVTQLGSHSERYVRIAPRPPVQPPPPLTPAPAPADTIKVGQSLLKPVTPDRPPPVLTLMPLKSRRPSTAPEPERPSTPPEPERPSTPPEPDRPSTPPEPDRPPTPLELSYPPTPPEPARPLTPPEPARRSSRVAAHNARAKLNDLMKQGTQGDAAPAGGEEGLDFSSAAGLEAADSDDDYDDVEETRRARGGGKRRRASRPPHPPHPPHPSQSHSDDMELDEDVPGGIVIDVYPVDF